MLPQPESLRQRITFWLRYCRAYLFRREVCLKRILLAFLAIACLALTPQTIERGLRRIVVEGPKGRLLAPRDTLTYRLIWGKAANATGYRVSVTATGSPVGSPATTTGLPANAAVTDTTITFSASNLTYDSLSFFASVQATRGTRVGASVSASWFVVKLPGTPGPIKIDSSAVPPPLASLETTITPSTIFVGGTAQACAFFKFSTGVVGMRSADAPKCSTVYTSKYTAAQRAVNCQTQDWLDGTTVCTPLVAKLTQRYAFAGVRP